MTAKKRFSRRPRELRPERLEDRRVLAVAVTSALPDVMLPFSAAAPTIDLAGHYDDTAVTGTVVRFDTNLTPARAPIFAELFDQAGPGRARTTPLTAANFLAYADAGSYRNTIIHRSMPGFVVQGGGFAITAAGLPLLATVPQLPTVLNEPGNTNVRGTIAMAKLDAAQPGGGPNSATNQWFFNLANNSANLDAQNGGFTAFARVLGSGMTVVDAIAAIPVYNAGSAFTDLPLQGTVDPAGVTRENLVAFPSIARASELVYTVTSSNPAALAATITPAGRLQLTSGSPRVPGVTTITVRATSVFDASDFVEDAFTVTLQPQPQPNAIVGRAGAELAISRGPAGAATTAPLATLPTDSGWKETLAGDFNGDGRTDVACRAADGNWWVTLTPAAGSSTPATPVPWGTFSTAVNWQFLMTGDFNGDGRTDIAGRVPSTGAWRVAQSTGSAFTIATFATWATTDTWTTALAGDFDGDGKTDIAGRRSSDGGWFVSQATSGGVTTTRWGTFSTAVNWQFLMTGDFNGDGRTDIAGRVPSTGAWRVAQSTGSAFTIATFATWTTAKTWTSALAVRA